MRMETGCLLADLGMTVDVDAAVEQLPIGQQQMEEITAEFSRDEATQEGILSAALGETKVTSMQQ